MSFLPRTDQADPQTVNAGIDDLPDSLSVSGIGIHIDNAPLGLPPDFANRRGNRVGSQRGFAFTALTETDDRLRCGSQMIKGNRGHFRHRGTELDPALWRRTTFRGLQRNTAETIGITDR